MEPLRTWTFEGEKPLTVTLYKPALTIRCGDGPEAELSPIQFGKLYDRFVDIEGFFDTQDPEVL